MKAPGPWSALPKGARRPARWLLAVGLATAVMVLLLRTVDGGEVLRAVGALAARPELLAFFVVGYSAAFLLRAIAWRAVLPGLPLFPAFRILQASLLANHALPVKAGEALRPYLAARRGVPLADAAMTTVVSRLLDMGCLILLSVGLLPVTAWTGSAGLALAVPAGLVAVAVVGVVWVRRLGLGRTKERGGPAPIRSKDILRQAQDERIPPPLRTPAGGPLRQIAGVGEALGQALRTVDGKAFVAAALWTLPSWVLEAAALVAAAEAFGAPLSVQAAVAVTAFTILFQVFHVTPGGLGMYEASMTGALILHGVPAEQALVLAVLTHGLKFAYAFTVGGAFALWEVKDALGIRGLDALRGSATEVKSASRLEIMAARAWNVLNEGKPFTPVFVLGTIALLSIPHGLDGGYWMRAGAALFVLTPLAFVFYRFDFPLKLRAALWAYLFLFLLLFRSVDLAAIGLALALYFGFTVFLWGTVYYHLRIGTSWWNFSRFWRLVLENPDPTSGNFLEQTPKFLLLLLLFQYLVSGLSWEAAGWVWVLTLGIGVSAVLIHQRFFTWLPLVPQTPTRVRNTAGKEIAKRVIVIAIDWCRADRLREAETPCIDRLRREGTEFTDMRTVYPARTVTCFSSMLTGAPPRLHGMSSNFVPRLGVKCDSLFTSLRRQGKTGVFVGIAHLIDAFGERDVRSVTAVTDNDEIDHALVAQAKQVLQEEEPDLLVLQLLSVDQTGHARGSYNREYLEKIEETDHIIQGFLDWCGVNGYLDDTTVILTADHGQGIGIGGHGHMSPSETFIPCILWGAGVQGGRVYDEPRSVMDIAPTIAYLLGTLPPEQSVGQTLIGEGGMPPVEEMPLVIVIPAKNEAQNLPSTLAAIPRDRLPGVRVVVVDDGSTDATGDVARAHGAEVIRHERNRGLGAALRTGLEAARRMNARAAVYIDADGEYDAGEIPLLLEPIERGRADYVLGSRYRGKREGQRLSRLAGNMFFTALLCVASGRLITDGQTGFRAFSRRALETAEIIHDYNYAQVLTLDLLKKGMRMVEVGVSYRRRTRGRSFIRLEYMWRVPVGMAREMWRG